MKTMANYKQSLFSSRKKKEPLLYDRVLLSVFIILVVMGLLMVASASVVMSEQEFHQPFYFLFHQLANLAVGLMIANWLIRIELDVWQKFASYFLILSILFLILVLIPGIGRHINGSARWVGVGPLGFQVSEFAKLALIFFLADYIVRRKEEIKTKIAGFLKPMLIVGIAAILLLKEPDFGATTVLVLTALAMLFIAGIPLTQFLILMLVAVLALAGLAISSPYRLARMTGFLNPWSNQYDTGYQLTQALIAFGRGGWFGLGLGKSIQKLFYLPEAHTDFVFAVFAEEFGLLGVFIIIFLFGVFGYRAFTIAKQAENYGKFFGAYLAYGITFWIILQMVINIGVNSGILPTKGLTLPFISYGGSSMIIMMVAIAFLFRVDYENRRNALKEFRGRYD